MKKLRVMCVAYPLRSARTATEKQVLSTYSNAFRRERRQSTCCCDCRDVGANKSVQLQALALVVVVIFTLSFKIGFWNIVLHQYCPQALPIPAREKANRTPDCRLHKAVSTYSIPKFKTTGMTPTPTCQVSWAKMIERFTQYFFVSVADENTYYWYRRYVNSLVLILN